MKEIEKASRPSRRLPKIEENNQEAQVRVVLAFYATTTQIVEFDAKMDLNTRNSKTWLIIHILKHRNHKNCTTLAKPCLITDRKSVQK
jgi:hypothetical protein